MHFDLCLAVPGAFDFVKSFRFSNFYNEIYTSLLSGMMASRVGVRIDGYFRCVLSNYAVIFRFISLITLFELF